MPGMAHAVSGRIVCSRCHQPMRTKRATHATGICDGGIALDEKATVAVCSAPPKLDDWQTRNRTRQIERALRRPGSRPVRTFEQGLTGPRRFDPPTNLMESAAPTSAPVAPTAVSPSSGSQLAAWLTVFFGVLTLSGGLAGIAWSLTAERTEYWNLALGLTLAGQGLLIFGLVLVVTRLWKNGRHSTARLHDVHTKLIQLQRTAESMAASRNTAAGFYADIALANAR
jgi:hypothetical protein